MYAAFSTATAAMFGRKQTLMLHLFTTTNNALRSTFGQPLCKPFWLGQRLRCTDLLGVSGGKATRNVGRKSRWHSAETCASSTTELWLTLLGRPEDISPLLAIDRWTEMGRRVAWPTRSPDLTPMDFFPCGHIRTLIFKFTSRFWRRSYCPYC